MHSSLLFCGTNRTLFDMNGERVGLTGGTPRPIWDLFPWYEWLLMGLALLAVIALIVYFCRRQCRKRRAHSDRQAKQPLLHDLPEVPPL